MHSKNIVLVSVYIGKIGGLILSKKKRKKLLSGRKCSNHHEWYNILFNKKYIRKFMIRKYLVIATKD